MVEDTGTWDKIKGKTNKVVGEIKGDKPQQIKGEMQETKGEVKRALDEDI